MSPKRRLKSMTLRTTILLILALGAAPMLPRVTGIPTKLDVQLRCCVNVDHRTEIRVPQASAAGLGAYSRLRATPARASFGSESRIKLNGN